MIEIEQLPIDKDYYISKNGEVFKRIYGRETSGGYLSAHIRKGKDYKIHRLVAQTFIPNPDDLPQVNHIDGNKMNNCVDNLEWCSQSHNIKHAYDNGLINKDNISKGVIRANQQRGEQE